jgi:hypothetical protein
VDRLSELLKEEHRVDPEALFRGLHELLRDERQGTIQHQSLQRWIEEAYLPGLLKKIKKDLSDRNIQNCVFSENPHLRAFGHQAIRAAQSQKPHARQPSAFLRALGQILNSASPEDRNPLETAGRWLAKTPHQEELKAAWIAGQDRQQNWLSRVPEAERPLVAEHLRGRTNILTFKKLAAKQQTAALDELFDHAKPESFQFVRFEIPKKGVKFRMGSPADEPGHVSIEPLREETLTETFELQTTPMTKLQKALLLGEDLTGLRDSDAAMGNSPATDLNWDDARKIAKKMSELDTEYIYRLPYEKEWEYAARAGTNTIFSFGDDFSELSDYAIHLGNSSGSPSGSLSSVLGTKTREVATRKPNPAGLHDMHGNIWEWCMDLTEGSRSIRGGSAGDSPIFLRSAQRDMINPRAQDGYIGLRLLRTRR